VYASFALCLGDMKRACACACACCVEGEEIDAEVDEEKKHEGTVDEEEEVEEVVVVEEEEADPNALNLAFVTTFPLRNHST
jgi:hypothetical protein